jgi:hypothetical protein
MDGLFSKRLEEKERLLHCPSCSQDIEHYPIYRAPHRQLRYWIITSILHLAAFFIAFSCVYGLSHSQSVVTKPQPALNSAPAESKPVDHDTHLIGTPLGSLSTLFSDQVY